MNKVTYGAKHLAVRASGGRGDEEWSRVDGRLTRIIEKLTHGRITITRHVDSQKTMADVARRIENGEEATLRIRDIQVGEGRLHEKQNRLEILDVMEIDYEKDGRQERMQVTKNGGRYYVREHEGGPWHICGRKETEEVEKIEKATQRPLTDYLALTLVEQGELASKYGKRNGIGVVGERLAGVNPGCPEYDTAMRMGIQQSTGWPTSEVTGVYESAATDWYPRLIDERVTINGIEVPRDVMRTVGRLTSTKGKNGITTVEPGKITDKNCEQELVAALNKTELTSNEKRTIHEALTSTRTIGLLVHLNDQTCMVAGELAFMNEVCKKGTTGETNCYPGNMDAGDNTNRRLTKIIIDRSERVTLMKINYGLYNGREHVNGQRESISAVAVVEVGKTNNAARDAEIVLVKQSAHVSLKENATLRTWQELREQKVQRIMWGTCIEIEDEVM